MKKLEVICNSTVCSVFSSGHNYYRTFINIKGGRDGIFRARQPIIRLYVSHNFCHIHQQLLKEDVSPFSRDQSYKKMSIPSSLKILELYSGIGGMHAASKSNFKFQ